MTNQREAIFVLLFELESCDGISLEEILTMGTSCPWAYSAWDFLTDGGSWNDYLFGVACTVERDFPT